MLRMLLMKECENLQYCLTLDIACGESMAYLVSAEEEVILPPTKYPYTKTAFAEILSCLEKVNSTDINIIMESISGYHLPAEHYLRDHTDYEIIIINPLISNANKHNLRMTKIDSLD